MSYNIQIGIETQRYRDYVTRGWRHFLPDTARRGNLDQIASLVHGYDLVGLQEVDSGSLRSGFVNQVEYLAQQANFPYWYSQTNRKLGKFAQHSNGLLTRYRPLAIREHKLPGMIPGRGALSMEFGGDGESLHVVLVHLALGQRARLKQLEYVADVVSQYRHAVVMGDLNCRPESEEIVRLRELTGLREPLPDLHTFPSWRPHRNIDHILVSSSLQVELSEVVDYRLSDHLPITMEITLPGGIQLAA